MRGAYVLKHQEFSFRGEIRPVVYYHHPFSEGIIDKTYTQVGLQMLMQVIRAHPMLYALGMGGYDRPLPRMLMALKWRHRLVPFYFRVNHPARFLRQMQALRRLGVETRGGERRGVHGYGVGRHPNDPSHQRPARTSGARGRYGGRSVWGLGG